MGRLFDAVAALAGVRQVVAYEAQAAIELEGLSRHAEAGTTAYAFAVDDSRLPAMIDATPVLDAIVQDVHAGVSAGVIGARFHRAVAALMTDLVDAESADTHVVALSGGVFQNALLLTLACTGLQQNGWQVLTHRRVPPNDGGIALGQLLVGNSC
jgi:hydrogenase maturation protein HypF